jgi:hypothetical protein
MASERNNRLDSRSPPPLSVESRNEMSDMPRLWSKPRAN